MATDCRELGVPQNESSSRGSTPPASGWLGPALRRRPTFLAKEVLFNGPLGIFIRSLGAQPVKAGGNDVSAYRVAKGIIDKGGVVAILPEGTRAYDGVMAEPKPGVSMLATRTRTPVCTTSSPSSSGSLGLRNSFADIGQSLATYFELEPMEYGTSFV